MFPPIFPIYVRALVPLYVHAPLLWLAGVVCLWATRYTHQLGRRLGSVYYVLSSLLRPAGVALTGIGWFALYAPGPIPLAYPKIGWLPRGTWTDVLCWLAIALFIGLGAWSVAALGLRRTFLFRRIEDSLVTGGPYAVVRHPQFLSAIGVTFFGTRLFRPTAVWSLALDAYYHSLDLNWALFAVSLWVLSILEDRELLAHFGTAYAEYSRRVPRLLAN